MSKQTDAMRAAANSILSRAANADRIYPRTWREVVGEQGDLRNDVQRRHVASLTPEVASQLGALLHVIAKRADDIADAMPEHEAVRESLLRSSLVGYSEAMALVDAYPQDVGS